MDQIVNVILNINKVHTSQQMTLDGGLGLSGLSQVYGPNHPTPL